MLHLGVMCYNITMQWMPHCSRVTILLLGIAVLHCYTLQRWHFLNVYSKHHVKTWKIYMLTATVTLMSNSELTVAGV